MLLRLLLKLLWNGILIAAVIFAVVQIVGWVGAPFGGIFNPNPSAAQLTPTIIARRVVVEAIKEVNKQVFIEHYNTVDVQFSEAPQGWAGAIGIKQEFIVLVRGRVPAGFDLQQLTEDDIWVSWDGKRIQLNLPPPIIFDENVTIDLENSRVLAQSDTCPDFICDDSLSTYQTDVLPAGKELLAQFAQENGILNQAAKDGKAYYEQLLHSLGFEEIRVIVNGYE